MLLNLKTWISNKLQEFDLLNKWKGLSLFKKIICISVIVSVVWFFAMLLIAFFVNYLIGAIVFFFWLAALFKPSIVKSNTRMQASKRILIPFVLIFLTVGIFCQYYTLKQKPTVWEYVVGSDAVFDEKGSLIKESNLNLMDRIFGNEAKLKGNILEKQESSILVYLNPFGIVYWDDMGSLIDSSTGQTFREARKGLFSTDEAINE